MSTPENIKEIAEPTEEVIVKPLEIFSAQRTKLISLRTYLFGYIRRNNGRNHHMSGLRAHAGKRVKATKEEWDELYSTY